MFNIHSVHVDDMGRKDILSRTPIMHGTFFGIIWETSPFQDQQQQNTTAALANLTLLPDKT